MVSGLSCLDTQCLVCVVMPPPQLREHGVHLLQSDHTPIVFGYLTNRSLYSWWTWNTTKKEQITESGEPGYDKKQSRFNIFAKKNIWNQLPDIKQPKIICRDRKSCEVARGSRGLRIKTKNIAFRNCFNQTTSYWRRKRWILGYFIFNNWHKQDLQWIVC